MTKDEQQKVDARIDELKSYAGKSFVRKDGRGVAIKVLSYAGIGISGGTSSHLFQVETIGARWTPPATQFLDEHNLINEQKL